MGNDRQGMYVDRRGGVRIGLVQSDWHRNVVRELTGSFTRQLAHYGVLEDRIDVRTVPGAFEVPFEVKRLALSGGYDAIATAGLIVDGGIYCHEFVSEAVISGLMTVQLDTGVPVLSGVLTPRKFGDDDEHRDFFAQHFKKKGIELAGACADILGLGQPAAADYCSWK